MGQKCEGCGADLALVGRMHRCIPRQVPKVLKKGRPRIGEVTLGKLSPWSELGMSRSTWYRRRAEEK